MHSVHCAGTAEDCEFLMKFYLQNVRRVSEDSLEITPLPPIDVQSRATFPQQAIGATKTSPPLER